MRDPSRPSSRGTAPARAAALVGRVLLLLCAAAAPCAWAGAAGATEGASAGLLLRQARYALAANDLDRARTALVAASDRDPSSARGLEAALLLAELEFTVGDRTAAERALARVQSRDAENAGAAAQLLLARGWLGIAIGDPAGASAAFASVAGVAEDPAATHVAAVGGAWADLLVRGIQAAPNGLRDVFRRTRDPALRLGAGLTLARVESGIDQPRRALNTLRRLRKFARHTAFSDDVELALALALLDGGKARAARQAVLRLSRRAAAEAGGELPPFPPPDPNVSLTLADLRSGASTFTARLAGLYASRPDRSEGLLAFFGRVLDRNALADLPETLRLIDARAREEA